MFADFIVSMGVFSYRDQNGNLVIMDKLFGLEMVGEVIYNVDIDTGIDGRLADGNNYFKLSHFMRSNPFKTYSHSWYNCKCLFIYFFLSLFIYLLTDWSLG